MGTRILRGRALRESDVRGGALAMVISEAMGKVLWPGQEALGQCVRIGGDTMPCTTVVGIAENIKAQKLADDSRYFFYYIPAAQFASDQGGLAVRTAGSPAAMKETVRRRLQTLMPGVSYVTVTPLSDVLDSQTQSWRLGATMFTVFGVLALVLAAIGLYSVIAYNVAQRTQEMGVRVALGANVVQIVRLVLGEGLRLSLVGVGLGGVIALVVSKWVAPLLFQVSPRDPLVFGGVALTLVAVAALASFVPARRAARVDPMQALRAE
jgi:ABC-type antimicrobial peptide transport system permease subunit